MDYLLVVHVANETADQLKPCIFIQPFKFGLSSIDGCVDVSCRKGTRHELTEVPGVTDPRLFMGLKERNGKGSCYIFSQHIAGVVPVTPAFAGVKSVGDLFDAFHPVQLYRDLVTEASGIGHIPEPVAGVPQYLGFIKLQQFTGM